MAVLGRLATFQIALVICSLFFLYRWTQLKSSYVDHRYLPTTDFTPEYERSLTEADREAVLRRKQRTAEEKAKKASEAIERQLADEAAEKEAEKLRIEQLPDEESDDTDTKQQPTIDDHEHHEHHEHDHDHEADSESDEPDPTSSSSAPWSSMPSGVNEMVEVTLTCETIGSSAKVTRPSLHPHYRYKQYYEPKRAVVSHEHQHSPAEYPQYKDCEALKKKFGIVPQETWGTAPADIQKKWANLICDEPYAKPKHHQKPFGGRNNTHQTLSADIDASSMPSTSTWIVFLTPMTTSHSKVKLETPKSIPYWTLLFDSFLAQSHQSLHDPKDPYYYSFFVGYDVGDPILDTEAGVRWIVNELHCRLDHAGIGRHKVGIRFFSMTDTVHAPSWGVSHLAHAAYDLGADYMYQINDDVEMKSPQWEDKMIGALKSTCNFGVSGPTDKSMERILTQSFVHRTHIEIFGFYFAMPFQNWWSDDWITSVYGSPYTHRSHGVEVKHRTDSVGQRYPVTQVQHLLRKELTQGKVTIQNWLTAKKREHCTSSSTSCYCPLNV